MGNSTDGKTIIRFVLLGASAFALATLTYTYLARAVPALELAFPRFLASVTLVKLLGDLVYRIISPGRRELTHLDDYLANDLFTFYRFALPLAVIQAYALSKGLIPPAYVALWRGAGAATLLYLVNRWLIEQAVQRRRRARGGVPVVRQRSTP